MTDPKIVEPEFRRPDQDIARDLRSRLQPLLDQVCAILDEANAAGLVVGFSVQPQPPLSKNRATIIVTKHL